jgi:hypothetical protein
MTILETPHLCPNGQKSYQIFWEAIGLERGPLSLVSITEKILEWKVATHVYKTD